MRRTFTLREIISWFSWAPPTIALPPETRAIVPEIWIDELVLANGATVPVPPALLEAIQDACPGKLIAGDAGLEAGRTAFVRRFLAALFAHRLLLVERGRPASKETVNLDAYSLVCSQKHEAQERLHRIGHLALAEGEGGHDLAEQLESLFAELTGHAPPDTAESARARIGDAIARVRGIVAAVLGEQTITDCKLLGDPTALARSYGPK